MERVEKLFYLGSSVFVVGGQEVIDFVDDRLELRMGRVDLLFQLSLIIFNEYLLMSVANMMVIGDGL
jgi:hypothetical protein